MADISNKLNKASSDLAGTFVEVTENTRDFAEALSAATGKLADSVKDSTEEFGKMENKLSGVANTLKGIFSKAGGAFKKIPGLSKMAALGPLGAITGAATLLFKQLLEVSNTIASISKDTGLVGKQLKGLTKEIKLASGGLYAYNMSMSDTAKQAAALHQSLGGTVKVQAKMIDVTARIAKAMGGSAQESAALADNLIRGFGKTAPQVEKFAQSIMTFATKSGVNARKVMRDISNDSNLTAIYLSRGEDYMAKTAVMAAKMGKSMADNLGTTDAFLNIESGSDLTGRLNQFFGSNLNALKMYNMAVKQDTVGVMKELNKVFSTPKGIAMIQKYPGIAKQLGAELGLNIKDMKQLGKVIKDMDKAAAGPTQKQIDLNKFIEKGMTLLDKLKGMIATVFMPIFNELGTILHDQLEPILTQGTKMASEFGKALSLAMDKAPTLGGKLKAAFETMRPFLDRVFNAIGERLGSAIMQGIKNNILGKENLERADKRTKSPAFSRSGVTPFVKNATGQVHNSPTLALIGEEHRSEVVIPTERIRKGMPVSNSVSRELQSIGVPGFSTGRGGGGASGFAASSVSAAQRRRSQSQMVYGSQGDPNAIKRREQQIEQQAAEDRAHQRGLVNEIMKEQEKLAREQYFSDAKMGAVGTPGTPGGRDKKGPNWSKWGKIMHNMAKGLDNFMKLTNTSWKDIWKTLPDKITNPLDKAFSELPENIKKGLTTGVETAWNHYLETGKLQESIAMGAAAGIRDATAESGEFTKAAGNIVAGMLEGKSWRKGLGEEMSKSLASKDGSLNKALGKLNDIAKDSSRSGLAQAAAAGGASALTAGVDTFAATGSFKEAGKAAVVSGGGAAVSAGLTAALTPALGPLAPLVGGIGGQLVSAGLSRLFGGKKQVNGPVARAKILGGLSGALRLARKPGGEQLYESFKIGSRLNKMANKNIDAAVMNSSGQMDSGLQGELISGVGALIQRSTGATLNSDEVMTFLSAMKGSGMQAHEQKSLLTSFERKFEGAGARGAIVNRPTVALIGEAGPEAVTPLDQTRGNGPLPGGGSGGDLAGEIRQMNQLLAKYVSNPPPINIDGQRVSRVINAANSDDIRTGVSTVNSRI